MQDIFKTDRSDPKPAVTGRRQTPAQFCETTCGKCGKQVGAYMHHYQIVACGRCGFYHWALQPHDNGPLVLFPHDGLNAPPIDMSDTSDQSAKMP